MLDSSLTSTLRLSIDHRTLGVVRVCFLATLLLALNLCFQRSQIAAQEANRQLASAEMARSAPQPTSRWPFEVCEGQFQIHSTVPINQVERFLPKLRSLPVELTQSLAIAIVDQPIHIVVLESRESLDGYLKRLLPDAPSRRALYIRHRGPGLVLTYLNPSWLTDVRHECTHALLDASGVRVPQWLDEGLAEYFETSTGNALGHATHSGAVFSQLRYGQVADIEQLERTDSRTVLSAKDYRDAWSITAFALNASSETRLVFQSYLRDLQNNRAGGFLSHRLKPVVRSWREEFTQFFNRASLEGVLVSNSAGPGQIAEFSSSRSQAVGQ